MPYHALWWGEQVPKQNFQKSVTNEVGVTLAKLNRPTLGDRGCSSVQTRMIFSRGRSSWLVVAPLFSDLTASPLSQCKDLHRDPSTPPSRPPVGQNKVERTIRIGWCQLMPTGGDHTLQYKSLFVEEATHHALSFITLRGRDTENDVG